MCLCVYTLYYILGEIFAHKSEPDKSEQNLPLRTLRKNFKNIENAVNSLRVRFTVWVRLSCNWFAIPILRYYTR